MRNYDLDFLKRFSMVIAFLALVTLGLILFAHHLNGSVVPEADSAAVRNTAAGSRRSARSTRAPPAPRSGGRGDEGRGRRSHPAGGLRRGTLDGSVIFGNLCTGCRTSGAGGAPKLDAAGIGARFAEQGLDMLVSRAISGYTGSAGVMPAKGGNPAPDRRAGQGHRRVDGRAGK